MPRPFMRAGKLRHAPALANRRANVHPHGLASSQRSAPTRFLLALQIEHAALLSSIAYERVQPFGRERRDDVTPLRASSSAPYPCRSTPSGPVCSSSGAIVPCRVGHAIPL